MSVPTRRTLFAAASAIVMGGGITAGAAASVADLVEKPDAELIALCAQFDVLERRRQQIANGAVTIEDEEAADLVWHEVRRQQSPMLNRMCSLPCTTLAGLGALAASLMLWDSGIMPDLEDNILAPANDRLTAALLRATLTGRVLS